ncbi:MAG: hypothetical protein K2F79_05585, partial [Muribaculaceae bacterium]|nr:hypothetical protein [Muribaculaceae bacterium]
EEYAVIRRDVYPALRHSDYTVKYAIRTYIDIEELKAVFASDPRRLRPVDFNRIADLYRDKDFDRYAEVMMKAAEIHPDDQQVNLNAANIAMQKGDLDSAAAYVAKAGDSPEATYTRGVLAALRGDEGRAEECFRLAASQGMQKAQDELDSLAELRSRPTVEYLIELKD